MATKKKASPARAKKAAPKPSEPLEDRSEGAVLVDLYREDGVRLMRAEPRAAAAAHAEHVYQRTGMRLIALPYKAARPADLGG